LKATIRHLLVPVLLMIVLPLFGTWVLCAAFGEGIILNTPFGIVDQDNSSSSRMLVRNIVENETFDVKFYSDTPSDLEDEIYNNRLIAGLIIPKNFGKDITAGNTPTVMLVYDGCQMSVVGLSKVKLTEVLMTIKAGASMQILEAKLNLTPDQALMYAQPISNTFRYIGNPEKSIANYVVPGTVATVAQLGIYIFMIEALRKEEGESVHPFLYLLPGVILSTIVFLACVWVMHHYFQRPMEGAWTTLLMLGLLNMIIIGNLASIMRLILPQKMLAIQTGVLIMAMMLLSGYAFPAMAMPPLFEWFSKLLPFTYFGIPLRDVMMKGSTTAMVMPSIQVQLLMVVITSVAVLIVWTIYRLRLLRKQNTALKATVQTQSEEVSSAC